jgi:hypothetical protein
MPYRFAVRISKTKIDLYVVLYIHSETVAL